MSLVFSLVYDGYTIMCKDTFRALVISSEKKFCKTLYMYLHASTHVTRSPALTMADSVVYYPFSVGATTQRLLAQGGRRDVSGYTKSPEPSPAIGISLTTFTVLYRPH